MTSSTQVAMSGLKSQVSVSDGTVGAPSIGFSNDVNTGLYRPGADALGVVTGGVERMRVDAAGNVGIGTGTPSTALHVTSGTVTGIAGTTVSFSAPSCAANSFNYVLNGGNDVGTRLVAFVNGSTRTDDGGANAATIRNDGGNFVLGSGSYTTTMYSSTGVQVQGYVKQSALPAFSAYRNAGTISAARTVVWNIADVNITNSYNNTTGIFTVPVAGTYFFSVFGMGDSGAYMHLQLIKNGNILNNCQPYENNGGTYQAGSGSTIATLAVGDQIYVYLAGGSMHGVANSHNGFCGYMIA